MRETHKNSVSGSLIDAVCLAIDGNSFFCLRFTIDSISVVKVFKPFQSLDLNLQALLCSLSCVIKC